MEEFQSLIESIESRLVHLKETVVPIIEEEVVSLALHMPWYHYLYNPLVLPLAVIVGVTKLATLTGTKLHFIHLII